MNIAVLCDYQLLPERIGGMDHFFWLFDEQCKQTGIDVVWFFPNEGHGAYTKMQLIAANGQRLESCFLQHTQDTGARYDVVITHFLELCTPFFKKAAKATKARIIAVDHNPRPLGGYPFKKRLEKRLKGLLYARAIDTFVAVSDKMLHDLAQDFGRGCLKKTKVVHNGIELGKFAEKQDFSTHTHFVTACHLRKEKGLQDLMAALSLIEAPLRARMRLDIYGYGPYESTLRLLADEFTKAGIVRFMGSVADLYTTYCQYDYLIHPSHGETFCYTVAEALQSNLPVITTHGEGNILGLVNEGKNGFLFRPGDAISLAAILSAVLSSKKKVTQKTMAEVGKPALSIENMVHNYLELL